FPEKGPEELHQIEVNYYKHLADVFLETISLTSVTRAHMLERMQFINTDQIEQATEGRSWIAAMAHYGSWEYTSSYSLHTSHHKVLGVYRPLADKGFDRFYSLIRSRFGSVPVPMKGIARKAIRAKEPLKEVAIALIADQNPPFAPKGPWIDFLNHKTLFFLGMEKLALKFHMPVAFVHIDKVKRGYYRAWFELIYDGQEAVENGEITRRYAQRLEAMIRRRPELWVWSHRRWKYEPPKEYCDSEDKSVRP
ncbi:MAG: lysophospholipid acyltransferase family protein, partial [Mucinivorans sp.]